MIVPTRRLLKSCMWVIYFSITLPAYCQNYQNNIDAASSWLASTSNPRVTLDDHAVVDGANSTRIMPYFANLGMMGFTKNSTYYTNVKNWMEWFSQSIDIYGAINDFDVQSSGAKTVVPDPDA